MRSDSHPAGGCHFIDTMTHAPRLFLLASLLALSGCTIQGGQSYPTAIPPEFLPTAIYQTAVAANATSAALTPSLTLEPTLVPSLTPTFTLTPIPSPTQTPTGIPPAPDAKIFIAAPGPMSRVASPINLRMNVVAGETQLVHIDLIGQDSGLIYSSLERVQAVAPTPAYVNIKINFELRAVSELARLQVSTVDRAGRIESLSSTYLILLSVGESQINPPPAPFERVVVFAPLPEAQIAGGVLVVDGAYWPVNNDLFVLELIDENGRPLGSRQLSLTGDTYVPFTTTIPYSITEPTRVRLVIRQTDDRIDGLIYLFSMLVNLMP